MTSRKEKLSDADCFDFPPLAKNIAGDIVSNFKEDYSQPIINIRGTWGLGKTFLVDLIKEKLEEKNIKVVKIDTWLVNDQKGIFKHISFRVLSSWQNFCFRVLSLCKFDSSNYLGWCICFSFRYICIS